MNIDGARAYFLKMGPSSHNIHFCVLGVLFFMDLRFAGISLKVDIGLVKIDFMAFQLGPLLGQYELITLSGPH